jgi:hypothetical protein
MNDSHYSGSPDDDDVYFPTGLSLNDARAATKQEPGKEMKHPVNT